MLNFPRASVVALFCVIFSGGCSEVLIHETTESTANEAVSLLRDQGIAASKDGDASARSLSFRVVVPKGQSARAWSVLRRQGLFTLTPTPSATEELPQPMVPTRAQELEALMSQRQRELESTLQDFSHVLKARVHFATGSAGLIDTIPPIVSASILIKGDSRYVRGSTFQSEQAKIKRLVANAVVGLKEERVHLTWIGVAPRQQSQAAESDWVWLGPVAVSGATKMYALLVMSGLLLSNMVLALLLLLTMAKRSRARSNTLGTNPDQQS